jgi:hypothetical protein
MARWVTCCLPTAATPMRSWQSSAGPGYGIDVAALAAKLQSDGEQSFDASWDSLLAALERTIGRLGGVPSPASTIIDSARFVFTTSAQFGYPLAGI